MTDIPGYHSNLPILLIEDNLGDARLVEILLEDYELPTHHVSSLQDGFEALEKGDYPAVMLDLHLPDSKGFQTVEKLLNKFPETNVIVLTGLPDKDLGLRAVKSGAQDYLVKGEFTGEELAKTLRYSIERNRIKKRLEEAQRIAHLGHWEYDLITKFYTASDEAFRIIGIEDNPEEFSIEDFKNFVFEDDRAVFDKFSSEILKKGVLQEDFRMVRPNGEVRYVAVSCQVVRGVDNKPRQVSGVVQDITERKLAAQELIKSQKLYSTVFNQSKDAIYISTEDGTLKGFNQAMIDLFGYSEEDLKDNSITMLYRNPSEQEAFVEAAEGSKGVKDFPIEIVTKSGEVRSCLITASKTTTEEFEGYHGTIRDITEQLRAQELIREQEVAEKSARLKEKFLANVSHEMRTPLNAVLGMSHLLMKTPLNEEQENYIKTIIGSSDHLLGIITDILGISTLQYGDFKLNKKVFDLRLLVTDLFNMVSYEAAEKNIQAELKIDKRIGKAVIGDPLRLREILLNLCSNAIKFTDSGSIKIDVNKIDEGEDSFELEFTVADTGIGIEEDKLDLIWENFTRVAASKDKIYEGVGLGLAIVKNIVEAQNGDITVESTYGEGSVFRLKLPFDKGELPEEEIKVTAKPKEVIAAGGDVKILLVEDEKVNQFVASTIIKKEWPNAKLTIASNGEEAIEKLKENSIDIVLMDIQMPVMDGIEATAFIREKLEPEKAQVPILAMTAHAYVAEEEKYKEYKMNDCVLKPFTPEDLFTKITKHIIGEKTEKNLPMDTDKKKEKFEMIDLSYLELMADGDHDMKGVLLDMLIKEPGDEFEKMKDLATQENWDELKQVSHKMKTTLPYIGYQALTDKNVKIDRILWELREQGLDESVIREQVPTLVAEVYQMYIDAKVELEQAALQLKQGVV